MPLHQQECFQYLKQGHDNYPVAENAAKKVVSLPMNSYVTGAEQETILNTLYK
jgi:dTDP-4-amino-4,6-dideoxygalactose transaminase